MCLLTRIPHVAATDARRRGFNFRPGSEFVCPERPLGRALILAVVETSAGLDIYWK